MNNITQYQNASPSKHLAGIYNQIPKPVSCRQKFPDNYPYKTQPDIYFHIADDRRDGAWQYYLWQGMEAVAAQGINQFDFTWVNGGEAGVKAQDASENGDWHPCNDNGSLGGAKPYD